MSEERLVAADEMALQWLTSERVLPTRNLQLSFTAAHDAYSFLTDYSLVVGIIRNNPGIVPDALLSAVEGFLKSLSTAKRLAAGRYQRGARRRYYDSVAAIRGVLDEFIFERDQGLHENDEDYSADIVARWLSTSHRAKAEDIAVIGSGDYLRLLARAIDHTPKEPLNKSRFRDAVENEVVADTALTLKSGDASGETADVCRTGVAEQGQADQA